MGQETVTDLWTCRLDGFTPSATTEEGKAVRLLEHYFHMHPGGFPDLVAAPVQAVIDELKGKFN